VRISAQGSAGITGGITLQPLPRRVRKVWLILHVVSSVGWLGVEVALLALGLTGLAAGDPAIERAMWTAAASLADTLLMPASVLSVLTGVVLGMGTKWGLAKHYWVFVKLILGLVLFVASAFTLNDNLQTAADLAAAANPYRGGDAVSLAGMMSVIGLLGLTAAVLSIIKPWGRINWRRTPKPARATRTRAQETS
jgi:hypothetical protein